MKELSNFKNHLAFDSKYKTPNVNTLDKILEDYNDEDDTALCKHCFFGGSAKVPILDNIPKKKMPSKRKTPRSSVVPGINKKGKTLKKQN